jgi:hypothetical protein
MRDEPWFRRWAWFSYKPITWQGRATLIAMVAVALPSAFGAGLAKENSPSFWLFSGVFIAAALIGHSIVLWKMERHYGRD